MSAEDDPLAYLDQPPDDVPRLHILNERGEVVPLTDDHPVIAHLLAIKDSAAMLREALEEIAQIAPRHLLPGPLGDVDRQLWIEESNRLNRYHKLRIALLREVERHMPTTRVPVLRDFSRTWLWNKQHPPDYAKLTAELEKIEHQANLKAVKMLNAQTATSPSAAQAPPIARCHEIAYQQYREAIEIDPSLEAKPKSAIYAVVKERCRGTGQSLPDKATWLRYIRKAARRG